MSSTTINPSADWATIDVNGKPHTFATVGALTISGAEYTVEIHLRDTNSRLINGWSLFNHPDIQILAWHTDQPGINPGAVMAAALAALLEHRPDLIPELVWDRTVLKSGKKVADALLATLSYNGITYFVSARYFEVAQACFEGAEDVIFSVTDDVRCDMHLLVDGPDKVNVASLFERMRTAPRLLK